ncbi:MAG: phosphoribosylanthranilate isomerase [Pyrinomonadaceae bacterium]
MVKVKVCGITNLEDALCTIEAGADALGFNFYRKSVRYIEPEAARRIIEELPLTVQCVGVFVNEETPEMVARLASRAGVTAVQLHGDETPEFCHALSERFIIKALRVGVDFEPESACEYKVDAILLDAFARESRGGTGRVIDWTIARRVRELVPKLFLAGGLSPDNVAAAVATVNPYAVDACSSLEHAPGRKDHARLRAFINEVKR